MDVLCLPLLSLLPSAMMLRRKCHPIKSLLPYSLSDAIYNFHGKKCAERKDNIFGLQAIVKLEQRIDVDYSMSEGATLKEVAKKLAQQALFYRKNANECEYECIALSYLADGLGIEEAELDDAEEMFFNSLLNGEWCCATQSIDIGVKTMIYKSVKSNALLI